MPVGRSGACKTTLCVTRDISELLSVADVELPGAMVSDCGETVRLNLNGSTVSLKVVDLTSPPEVIPLMVTGYTPGGVVVEVEMIIFDPQDRRHEVGEKVAKAPVGKPETEKATFSAKPVMSEALTTA